MKDFDNIKMHGTTKKKRKFSTIVEITADVSAL
jgi:hypothetical protein